MNTKEIEEARKFLLENPDKEKYIAENYKTFWNWTYDEPDDDSIVIAEEWDNNYKLVKKSENYLC